MFIDLWSIYLLTCLGAPNQITVEHTYPTQHPQLHYNMKPMASSTLSRNNNAALLTLCVLLFALHSRAQLSTVAPLDCYDLTAFQCNNLGPTDQCCVVGGACCADGSCCGVGQQCVADGGGSSYSCCAGSNCPGSETSSASDPGSSSFQAQIPCSPAEGYSWYCDFGQSCGLSTGSCLGVATGSGGGGGSSSDSSSSDSTSSGGGGGDSNSSSDGQDASSGSSGDSSSSDSGDSTTGMAAGGVGGMRSSTLGLVLAVIVYLF